MATRNGREGMGVCVKVCYCLVSHGWDRARSHDELLRNVLLKHHDTVLHITNKIKEGFEYVYHKI